VRLLQLPALRRVAQHEVGQAHAVAAGELRAVGGAVAEPAVLEGALAVARRPVQYVVEVLEHTGVAERLGLGHDGGGAVEHPDPQCGLGVADESCEQRGRR